MVSASIEATTKTCYREKWMYLALTVTARNFIHYRFTTGTFSTASEAVNVSFNTASG